MYKLLKNKALFLENTVCLAISMIKLILGLVLLTTPLISQAASTETAVKAGFIYNFSKFIEWPADTTTNYKLCVIGENTNGDSLDVLENKIVGDKPLVVKRHIKEADIKECHMLVMMETRDAVTQNILEKIATLPIVTVSDSPDFVVRGGMIGLIRDGNRVGFEVNMQAANMAGLRISAQLLKLAKSVKGLK